MKFLEDFVGIDHLVPRVRSFLKTGQWPRGIVLRGPTGTGKTSLASYLARAYTCQSPGTEGAPCNKCPSCRDILSGEFSRQQVVRVNGDSESSKDTILSALDLLRSPSLFSGRRVLWVEEAGFLSEAAKGALHTFLEEPVDVLVILTSMHQSLPKSLVDRCQSFNFRLPSAEDKLTFLRRHLSGLAPESFWAGPAKEVVARTGGSYRELQRLVEVLQATGDFSAPAVLAAIADSEGNAEALGLLEGLLRKDWGVFDQVRRDTTFMADRGHLIGYLLLTGLSYATRPREGLSLWEDQVVRVVLSNSARAVQLSKVFEGAARVFGGRGWDRFVFLKGLLSYMLEG